MAAFTVDSGAVMYDGRLLYAQTAAYTVLDTYENYLKSVDDIAHSKITVTVAFTATTPIDAPDYIPDLGGLQFKGTCNASMVASTTDVYIASLVGYGNDFFNADYYMQVVKNANSIGAAPSGQINKITDYVSATGKFICNAFSANVEANDEIIILHESLAINPEDGILKVTIADGTTIPNNSQAAGGLLATAFAGDVYIEQITVQRGATNMVGPTTYRFSTDNAGGLTGKAAPFVSMILAKFNANLTSVATIDGTAKQLPYILESGKKLYIDGDNAATSAGGTTTFYIKYKKLAPGAKLV